MRRHITTSLYLLVLIVAPYISASAQTPVDGVFSLPYVCGTYSTVIRLHEILKTHPPNGPKLIVDLLDSRICFTMKSGTLFRIVRHANEATQIELIKVVADHRQSLGLYWGATEELSAAQRRQPHRLVAPETGRRFGLLLGRAALQSVANVDPVITGPNNAGAVVAPASKT
jgi:hypothetical protein